MKERRPGFRVLIVGCGKLGSRHLKEIATLPMVHEIEVVDPRPEALEIGRRLMSDVPQRSSSLSLRWVTALEDASESGDLCIVATPAHKRCQTVSEVASKLKFKKFLVEKLVAKSVAQYQDLISFTKQHQLQVWVHLNTRAYPIHKYVKQRIGHDSPIFFTVVGANHNMASHGVHHVDLFVYYDESKQLKEISSQIDEFSGTVQAATQKGSHLTLSYALHHNASECISINSPHYRCIMDPILRWFVESDAASGWQWRQIPFGGDLMEGSILKQFAKDILTSSHCELPTLEESFLSHQFILKTLEPHFQHFTEAR